MDKNGLVRRVLACLIGMALVLSGCVENAEQTAGVSVKFNGFYDQRFAGFFVAKELGYYLDNGLNVTFVPAGHIGESPLDSLLSGDVEFAVTSASDLLAQDNSELVAIAAVYQKNPYAYFSLSASNIMTPFDFEGKRAGYYDELSKNRFFWLADELRINTSNIELVAINSTFESLINQSVDVYPGYVFDDAVRLDWQGYELNTVLEEDYGGYDYASIIVVNRELAKEHPGLVRAFLSASLGGWQYSLDQPSQAVNYTLRYMGDVSYGQQLDVMHSILNLVRDRGEPVGWMSDDVWRFIVKREGQFGMTNITEPGIIYTTDFLQEIYAD